MHTKRNGKPCMNTEPRKTKHLKNINEMRDERREHRKTKNLINEMRDEMRDERRSQLHAQDYFKELPYYDLEKYDDLENEIAGCEFSGLELQVRIDQLSKKKHDLTILLQDPTFLSRKTEQYILVCDEERSLLNFIDDMSAGSSKQTVSQKYDKQTYLKKYKLLRRQQENKQYLHYLIHTAKMVKEDKNEAQKVRQKIEKLQTQINDLELEFHENETRIDALQTKKTDLESEMKQPKTPIMHFNSENFKCKARTHGIEQNHNAANVYCVNLNN